METNKYADHLIAYIPIDKLADAIFNRVMEANRINEEKKLQEKLLTAKEVAQLFSVSTVTITSWVSKGVLTKYSIGGRTKFKFTEVMDSLKTIKRYGSIK